MVYAQEKMVDKDAIFSYGEIGDLILTRSYSV